MQTDSILDRMKDIVRNNDICVLATTDGSRPHTSLMAYVWADDGLTIYLLTRKGTRKFRNLTSHPDVSILIDTRCGAETSKAPLSEAPQVNNVHTDTQALTITGRAEILAEDEASTMLNVLAQQHPQIKGLATASDAAVIRVKTVALQLLDGAENAFLEKV